MNKGKYSCFICNKLFSGSQYTKMCGIEDGKYIYKPVKFDEDKEYMDICDNCLAINVSSVHSEIKGLTI